MITVSAQRGIAIMQLVCFLSLLTLFAQNVFEWCIQITVKTKISSHCAPPHNYCRIAQFEEGTPACT
jgi:hypothetical protein